ncbi:DUF7521 family protein [Halorarius litoreus]|uniref:DUF7521 family protein n=1 Tax=Halorarius litoreus TaxID=2962676 RepID=UPI0020CB84DE|nr:hypothetical protein [Halorarius litoreus]
MTDTTLALTAVRVVVFVLGVAVTAISFRAYQRERTRYLRDATVGLGIITAGVLLEGLLFQFTSLELTTVHLVESVAIGLGFLVLLSSFLR